MDARRFDWNDDKAAANVVKHGIRFEDAVRVFLDPAAVVFDAGADAYGGERFGVTGRVADRMLTVIATERDAVTWIISARRASRKERRHYG